MEFIYLMLALFIVLWILHIISYAILKTRVLKSQVWDLNICCGKTDGGGINADICQHKEVPRFELIDDIYQLPYRDKQFKTVLCSHTIEHVDDPRAFFLELERIAEKVTIVIPPLYDVYAVCDVFEHKWIFLSFRKKHHSLPKFIKLPLSNWLHKILGQFNHA